MKLRGKSGQNRKDKSIDGENDVNVEVTVQKRSSGGNGNENATETVRRESVKLGQREGRRNTKRKDNNKRRKGGLKTEYCMDEEVKNLNMYLAIYMHFL